MNTTLTLTGITRDMIELRTLISQLVARPEGDNSDRLACLLSDMLPSSESEQEWPTMYGHDVIKVAA